jgi:hypothetical protein
MKQRKYVMAFLAIVIAIVWAAMAAVSLAQSRNQNPPQGAITGSRSLTPPGYVFSPDVPHDAPTFARGAAGTQPFVDILAWNAFIALNWPAPNPIKQRGIPDRTNIIGGYFKTGDRGDRKMPNGPVVWETYKDTDDIFLKDGVKPTGFDAAETVPSACAQLAANDPAAARRTMFRLSKFTDAVPKDKQVDGNRLVDQNGHNVVYEVKVNRVYYDYVVSNGFYNRNNQVGKTIDFPTSSDTTAHEAAIRVKAAWKVLGGPESAHPDDASHFYTTKALVFDPVQKSCSDQTMGLVGLHISIKTAELPQWTWATFEQVDNAPTDGHVGPQKYNFYDPQSKTPPNTPPKPGSMEPTQVVRVTPLNLDAETKNETFQTALKGLRSDNVWQYYMLVDAQWAGLPTPVGKPQQPQYLANTTLETYLQGPTVEARYPRGCLNCHAKVAAKDFDFQIAGAQAPKENLRHPELLGGTPIGRPTK